MTTTTAKKQILKRAAIYVRISAAEEGDENGVNRQLQDCQERADKAGATVRPEHVFQENDTSATTYGTRKLYRKLIQLVRDGEIDLIICWASDRLLRLPRELEDLIDLANKGAVAIMTITGEMDLATPAGRLNARILTSVAINEIDVKHDRTVRANLQRAQQGQPYQVRSFGYRTDGTVVPAEAEIVKEAFRRWVGGGSINGITTWLNTTGYPSTGRRRGANAADWTRKGLRCMLANPRYTAQVTYRGEVVPGAVAQWDRLVDDVTFAAAQRRLEDQRPRAARSPAKKWLGAGFYLCADCLDEGVKTPMISAGHKRPQGYYERRYRCPTSKHGERRAEKIDAHVIQHIVDLLRSERFREKYRAGRADAGSVQILIDEKAEKVAERARGAALRVANEIDKEDWLPLKARLNAEIVDLERKIAKRLRSDDLGQLANADDPGADWLAMDIWQQTKVAKLICQVTVRRTPLNEQYRFDPNQAIGWVELNPADDEQAA